MNHKDCDRSVVWITLGPETGVVTVWEIYIIITGTPRHRLIV